MSEIRDRVIVELRSAGFTEGQINYVLGMREVAIVDREAKFTSGAYGGRLPNQQHTAYWHGIEDLQKAGWVKESGK